MQPLTPTAPRHHFETCVCTRGRISGVNDENISHESDWSANGRFAYAEIRLRFGPINDFAYLFPFSAALSLQPTEGQIFFSLKRVFRNALRVSSAVRPLSVPASPAPHMRLGNEAR